MKLGVTAGMVCESMAIAHEDRLRREKALLCVVNMSQLLQQCLYIEGIVAVEIIHGSVDGDAFYSFICKSLLSKLMHFNGYNPNSVIIRQLFHSSCAGS